MWWVLLWGLHGRVVVLYIRDGAVQYFCRTGCSCCLDDASSLPSGGDPPIQGRGWVVSGSRFPGMTVVCGNANRIEKHRKKNLFQLHFSPGAFPKISACLFLARFGTKDFCDAQCDFLHKVHFHCVVEECGALFSTLDGAIKHAK